MMDPFVVIVIPCVSMNAYVLECLRACLQLDYGNYRMVLLPDLPVTLPAEFQSELLLVQPTGDVTIGAKRNAAINAFPDAAYFALVDSDAFPRRDWLRKGIAAFAASGALAVGGPALSPPGEPLREKAVGNATRSVMVSGNLAFSKKQGPARFCHNLHSCNLILSRAAIEVAGLFNEHLRTGEDREYCHRIGKRGGTIYFEGAVAVYHHNRPLVSLFFAQQYVRGYSIFAIASRGRVRDNVILFAPLGIATVFIACLIWGFVSPIGWVLCGASLGVYFIAAMVESSRHSGGPREVPATLTAIILSNVGYLAGSIVGLVGGTINFKRLYRNFPGQDGE